MFEYSIYSVISLRCFYLWRIQKASKAAEILAITARLQELGLIDGVLEEPLGGNHRDYQMVFSTLKKD